MSEIKTNKLSSLASNNDITIDPDGTGDTIIASGNLGVGTVSPSGKLNLATGASTACELRLTSNNTGSGAGDRGRIVVYSARNDGTAYEAGKIEIDRSSGTADEAHILFATNNGSGNTERMRISSAGEINVAGKSSNANNIGNTYFHVQNANRGHDLRFAKSESGSFDALVFYHNGSAVGYISYGNSSTSYNTSSDYRLKENVADITGATDRLKQLNPVRFNFIADADTTVDGFLAHEVQDIVPEAITGTKDAVDDDGNAVMQGIDQSKLVPLLVATIQEQQAAIEALTARVTALEAN